MVFNKLKSQSGMSLVEVLISLGVLLIFSLALITTHISTRHSAQSTILHASATDLARTLMENQKNLDYDAITSQFLDNQTIFDNGTVDTGDDVIGSVNIVVVENANQTKDLSVTVQWNQRHLGLTTLNSVNLATLVTNL